MTQERLAQKTFQSAVPSLILQVLSQGIGLVTGILLVRLLEPKDYGIWGILMVFWSIGLIFTWGGLGSAIIQKKDVDKYDLDSVFFYNMFIAGLLALLLYLGAGWLADFFHQPVLKSVTRLLVWGLPIAALGAVQHSLLCRKMRQYRSSCCGFPCALHRLEGVRRLGFSVANGYRAKRFHPDGFLFLPMASGIEIQLQSPKRFVSIWFKYHVRQPD